MEPKDAQSCAAVIARHPVLAPRYGEAIQHLAPAWLKIVGSEAMVAAVFEDVRGTPPVLLGAGVTVFVTDEFITELKNSPHFWMGPELASRTVRGRSPVLSNKQMREANTVGGLNVAVWQRGVLPEDKERAEVSNTIMMAFVQMHRGFLFKEIVVQAETEEHAGSCRTIGARFWNSGTSGYTEFPDVALGKLVQEPHVLGLTRDLAFEQSGSWSASTFLYHRPRFGFSRSEQRLLSCGLGGGTDLDIADKLGISLVTVRKTWRAIYERVAAMAPELALCPPPQRDGSVERGKGKKQRLLFYIIEHPEELRPVSRRSLRNDDTKSTNISAAPPD
jgi:DNA-binding CsgD family transcriptional regulator